MRKTIHVGAFIVGGVLAMVGKEMFVVDRVEPYVEQQAVEVDDRPEVPTKLSKKDRYCLAKNIYHEAGVESHKGKLAVAQVTFNRLETGKWGKTVCSVVYAKAQFSWTLNKSKRDEQPKGKLWEDSLKAVDAYMAGERVKMVKKSNHYHTNYIKRPKWADPSKVAAIIGQHIFYAGV